MNFCAARRTLNIHPSSAAVYPAALGASGAAAVDPCCLGAEVELQPDFIARPQRYKPFRPGVGKPPAPGGHMPPVELFHPSLHNMKELYLLEVKVIKYLNLIYF